MMYNPSTDQQNAAHQQNQQPQSRQPHQIYQMQIDPNSQRTVLVAQGQPAIPIQYPIQHVANNTNNSTISVARVSTNSITTNNVTNATHYQQFNNEQNYPTCGTSGALMPNQIHGILSLLNISQSDLVFWCRASRETLKKAEKERRWVIFLLWFVLFFFAGPFAFVGIVFLSVFYCCADGLSPHFENGSNLVTIVTKSRGVISYNVKTHAVTENPWAQIDGFEHFEPGVKEACYIRPTNCCVSQPIRCQISVLLPGQHQYSPGFCQGPRVLKDMRIIFCEEREFDFVMGNLAYLKAQSASRGVYHANAEIVGEGVASSPQNGGDGAGSPKANASSSSPKMVAAQASSDIENQNNGNIVTTGNVVHVLNPIHAQNPNFHTATVQNVSSFTQPNVQQTENGLQQPVPTVVVCGSPVQGSPVQGNAYPQV